MIQLQEESMFQSTIYTIVQGFKGLISTIRITYGNMKNRTSYKD